MNKQIMIVGAGFAGFWAALSAARLIDLQDNGTGAIDITVIAPTPTLTLRPRLYEADVEKMCVPLAPLFEAVGVQYLRGSVEKIRTATREIEALDDDNNSSIVKYDRLIIATGSKLFRPNIPGLREHAFSIDQLSEAVTLQSHIEGLPKLPDSASRNTVVVVGGGFTGIELAAEMPARLRSVLGSGANVRVVVVEQAGSIGPDLGPGPRPVITKALTELGVECTFGEAVISVDESGVVLASGKRIDAKTVVWTAGLRASTLTEQIPGVRDDLGRLHVDRNLRVPASPDVFASGDAAFAATDDAGNHSLMSCQHAMALGRSAGNNAAADLLGLPSTPYSQPRYVTCLDLGPWGAVLTEGWERVVQMEGADAKVLKRLINSELIYPPKAERAEALSLADPTRPVVA